MEVKRLNEDILENPIKRQKLHELQSLITQSKHDANSNLMNKNEGFAKNSTVQAQLNNTPKGFLPILQPPYRPEDFFTDLNYNFNKLADKVGSITKILPPPIPPLAPNDEPYGSQTNPTANQQGIMIPFIFPPPPIIKPDPLIDNIMFNKSKYPSDRDNEIDKEYEYEGKKDRRKRKEKTYFDDDEINEEPEPEEFQFDKMVNLAPLPFPPKGYMPYPLEASKSTLTPHDVFTDFIDAADLVPRIDMVAASAAGTLVDLKIQAQQENFSSNNYESQQLHQYQYDENDSINDQQQQNYYDKIKISAKYDKFDKYNKAPINHLGTGQKFITIDGKLSNEFGKSPELKNNQHNKYSRDNKSEIQDLNIPKLSSFLGKITNRDFNNGDFEFRRKFTANSINKMEQFLVDEMEEIYKYEKNKLLAKIQDLKESKISFTDSEIKDAELLNFQRYLETERDLSLIELRMWNNYEYLKLSANFYNDSNKIYKKYNGQTTNKLMKLKNFLQYQKLHFEKLLKSEKSLNDLVDLNNRDVDKIFQEVSERDYGLEIKELCNMSNDNQDNTEVLENLKINKFNIASPVQSIKTSNNNVNNKFKKSSSPNTMEDITDFLTITTVREFDLITGTLKNFKKDNRFNNIKHQIFKNKLYETSGSDSNSSNYNSATPETGELKRRGGRRNMEVDEDNLHLEPYLLARIMKHFKGPESVNNDELNDDFESMGIKSNW